MSANSVLLKQNHKQLKITNYRLLDIEAANTNRNVAFENDDQQSPKQEDILRVRGKKIAALNKQQSILVTNRKLLAKMSRYTLNPKHHAEICASI